MLPLIDRRKTLLSVLFLLVLLPLAVSLAPPDRPAVAPLAGPQVVLWAWEMPEDLRFLDAKTTGVAYLAETWYVTGADARRVPRMQPLKPPAGAWLMAVVRIEARAPLTFSDQQLGELAERIARVASAPGVRAVQIDFDATASERDFYARLLRQLRARLPQDTPLSITALASWCTSGEWVSTLPVDEAVPMLFRLGVSTTETAAYFRTHEGFSTAICSTSVGVSTDERLHEPPPAARTYIFSPRPWSAESVRAALQQVDHASR